MMVSQWVTLPTEPNIAVKAQCVKCTAIIPPEQLRLLVVQDPRAKSTRRQAGRLRICGLKCLDSIDRSQVQFNQAILDLTAEDIRHMIDAFDVCYTLHDHDLLVDFCIVIHRYREDVRFQNL